MDVTELSTDLGTLYTATCKVHRSTFASYAPEGVSELWDEHVAEHPCTVDGCDNPVTDDVWECGEHACDDDEDDPEARGLAQADRDWERHKLGEFVPSIAMRQVGGER